jgi:hypothetical protein
VTATGTDVDDPGDRPALLVTADMHAREFAGSWTALHLLDRIVENYGEDPALTDLLDRRTAYVVPRVCPDGAEFVLGTRTRKCRSRFVDLAPGDVRDPNVVVPGDLSGDGRILSMRWPAEDGDHVVPDDEPRLTLPRDEAATAGTFYRHTVEGPVLNYDGGPVSEVEMRSDFNCVVARSPRPQAHGATGGSESGGEERVRTFTTARNDSLTVHDGPQTVREGWRATEATVRVSAWMGRGQPAPTSGPSKRA